MSNYSVASNLKFSAAQPNPVGYWVMQYADEVQYTLFAIYAKPTDEQIKNTESLLGWKWRDA